MATMTKAQKLLQELAAEIGREVAQTGLPSVQPVDAMKALHDGMSVTELIIGTAQLAEAKALAASKEGNGFQDSEWNELAHRVREAVTTWRTSVLP